MNRRNDDNWLRQRALSGNRRAAYKLGARYFRRRSKSWPAVEARFAFHWILLAALRGDVRGMFRVADMLVAGVGCEPDPVEAFRWFSKAGEAGHPSAALVLGRSYALGKVVAKNLREAEYWFKRALELGAPGARFALARFYADNPTFNVESAFEFYLDNAENGDVFSTRQLIARYWNGVGVARDENEALVWTIRAVYKGDAEALDLFESLCYGK